MVDHSSELITVAKAVIAPAYLLIAALLYWGAGDSLWRTKTGRAVAALVLVFVLCDLASYLAPLMGLPLRLVEYVHVALAVASWAFIFMRQTQVIAVALNDE